MDNPSKRYKAVEVDLKNYRETEFVSKNIKLQQLFDKLLNESVAHDVDMHRELVTNNYRWFDQFVTANPGIDNFYAILQQLFLLKYFLPAGIPPLTRKQFQNALGIQQVRWSTDPSNPNTFPAAPLTMHFYQDFVTDPHCEFNKKLMSYYSGILREDKKYQEFSAKDETQQRLEISAALQDTIWYSYQPEDYLRMYASQDIFWLKADGDETIPSNGLRSTEPERLAFNYYPLPEMMWNVGDMFCFHTPELVFGVLTPQTLTKYIVINGTRPYHMHLAGERPALNLLKADGVDVMIEMFWTHDMQHERMGLCTPENNYNTINRALRLFCRSKGIDECTEVTAENIKGEFENSRSILNQFIDSRRDAEGRRVPINTFLVVNDEPAPWNGRAPRVGGKTKRRFRSTRAKGRCKALSRRGRLRRS